MNFGVRECDQMETPDSMSVDSHEMQGEAGHNVVFADRMGTADRSGETCRTDIGSRASESPHADSALGRFVGTREDMTEITEAVSDVRRGRIRDLAKGAMTPDFYLRDYINRREIDDALDQVISPPGPVWQ